LSIFLPVPTRSTGSVVSILFPLSLLPSDVFTRSQSCNEVSDNFGTNLSLAVSLSSLKGVPSGGGLWKDPYLYILVMLVNPPFSLLSKGKVPTYFIWLAS
jgi:hypothetical protein